MLRLSDLGGEGEGTADARSHGTAVMGMLLARENASGLVGMAPKADGFVHSALINGTWNTAGAIARSTKRLRPGDVMIIELQDRAGPDDKLVAMQYWNPVFSAIRAATEKGICVVEAAGNGNENFDRAAYGNTGLQKDCGAIVVGAGVSTTNYVGFDGDYEGRSKYEWLGPPRSRLFFSNYGSIVNVQAWGWNVTTMGYGDAQGGHENDWYTHRFSGTSSAAAIIAGAVALIQSNAKKRYGRPLSPADVRRVLIESEWSQEPSDGAPLAQHIGPQPDLLEAIELF